MKYVKTILALSLYMSAVQNMQAQESSAKESQKEWSIGIGMSLVARQDDRVSALTYKSWQPVYHMGWQKTTVSTRQTLDSRFTKNLSGDRNRILNLRFVHPDVVYSLEKKVGDVWIGGVFNSATMLSFPSSTTNHFENVPINYTISNTLGIKVSYENDVALSNGDALSLGASAEASLLGYVIRPAYGHPYPDQFLESGTFSPTRSKMTGPLLRSGKIRSLGSYQSFRLQFGISYIFNERVSISLNVRLSTEQIQDVNRATWTAQDMLLKVGYIY